MSLFFARYEYRPLSCISFYVSVPRLIYLPLDLVLCLPFSFRISFSGFRSPSPFAFLVQDIFLRILFCTSVLRSGYRLQDLILCLRSSFRIASGSRSVSRSECLSSLLFFYSRYVNDLLLAAPWEVSMPPFLCSYIHLLQSANPGLWTPLSYYVLAPAPTSLSLELIVVILYLSGFPPDPR